MTSGWTLGGQQLQHVGGDRRLEMGEHQRGDLRMLVLDQGGDRLGVHPAQRVERAAAGRRRDPGEHVSARSAPSACSITARMRGAAPKPIVVRALARVMKVSNTLLDLGLR